MWSMTKVIGLVILPLMIGSAVLGSLQTLKTESVDEEYGTMDALLESRHSDIIIDNKSLSQAHENSLYTSSRPGREIIRDAIIVNQLSALSCDKAGNLINGYMLFGYLGQRDTTDDGTAFYPIRVDYSLYQGVSESDNHPYYAISGRPPEGQQANLVFERAPLYASQFTDWNPACIGMQKTSDFTMDPVGSMIDGAVDTVTSIPADTFDFFTCTSTPSWAKNSGNDMEGRYGRIPFKISDDISEPIILSSGAGKPPNIRNDRVWAANFAVKGGTCWQEVGLGVLGSTAAIVGGTATGNPAVGVIAAGAVVTSMDYSTNLQIIPTMAGLKWSSYAPYHSKIIEGDRNWATDDLDLRKGHIVVNTPMYLAGNNPESYIHSPDLGNDGKSTERALRLRERARYVLCPGVEGYIQTNRENDGRSGGEHVVGSDNPDIGATHITSYVVVTSEDAGSCMEGSSNSYVTLADRLVFSYYDDGCKDKYDRC